MSKKAVRDESSSEERFDVEKVMGHRVTKKNRIEYKIKWKNWDDSWNAWLPMEDLFCFALIERYHKDHPLTNEERQRIAPKDQKKHNLSSTSPPKKKSAPPPQKVKPKPKDKPKSKPKPAPPASKKRKRSELIPKEDFPLSKKKKKAETPEFVDEPYNFTPPKPYSRPTYQPIPQYAGLDPNALSFIADAPPPVLSAAELKEKERVEKAEQERIKKMRDSIFAEVDERKDFVDEALFKLPGKVKTDFYYELLKENEFLMGEPRDLLLRELVLSQPEFFDRFKTTVTNELKRTTVK